MESDGSSHIARRFQGSPGCWTVQLMPGNALGHVFIPGFCSGHKQDVIPTQLLGESLRVGTLPTAGSSQDQEQAPHTMVSFARWRDPRAQHISYLSRDW